MFTCDSSACPRCPQLPAAERGVFTGSGRRNSFGGECGLENVAVPGGTERARTTTKLESIDVAKMHLNFFQEQKCFFNQFDVKFWNF